MGYHSVGLGMLVLALASSVAAASVLGPRPLTYALRFIKDEGVCTIIEDGMGQVHRLAEKTGLYITRTKNAHHEHDGIEVPHQHGQIVSLYGKRAHDRDFQAKFFASEGCTQVVPFAIDETPMVADEVIPIVQNGDPTNRIDIVFMGDGYQARERQRFIDDMKRLTDDMFASTTFFSHLPLFNIWAVFRESVESGIGVGGVPKNTAFGLYRDGTELRGVYCSKPAAARDACGATGTGACDFPSLIGNDEFYGGLGGEFTISTRSLTSGTIVLRHELGHNLIDVGEEYDGGQAYSGVNASPTLNVKWSHWLTNPGVPTRAEQSQIRVQDYAWYDLGNGPYTIRFNSDGTYSRWFMRFTVSGCETPGSLRVTLDGVDLPWNTTGQLDRTFFEYYREGGFSSGSHTLVFSQGFPPEVNQIRQLCSVTLHEYKNETLFRFFDREFVGAYPTWRQGGSLTGYRPGNEKCLMRNMSSTDFCSPCIEGMWQQLLARMSLIDDVVVTTAGSQTSINLKVVPLAQFREGGARPGEVYSALWRLNNVARPEFDNQFSISLPTSSARGIWSVTVSFTTPEIRHDPSGVTTSTETFVV